MPFPFSGRAALAACLAPLGALALLPANASAQSARSVLDFIPVEAALRLPEAGSAALATGTFTGDEVVLTEGTPVRAWSFEGSGGDRVSVTLRSRDFDAVVLVVGPGLGAGLSDDDGAGGTDSRICLTLPESGTFRAVASALDVARGTFELALARLDEASEALCPLSEEERLWGSPLVGTLSLESPVSGRLDPDVLDAADLWRLELPSGEAITILLESDEFDAFLDVGGPESGGEAYSDDDGGGGCDARVELVPAGGSTYLVRVSTATGGGGAYRLSATRTPPPASDAPCGGGDGGLVADGSEEEAALLVEAASSGTPERVLRVGREVTAALAPSAPGFGDGTPAHVWKVEDFGAGALRVEVLSDEFDPYLYLFVGEERLAYQDDDGAGGLGAGITVTVADADDEVWIVVRPLGPVGEGRYRVRALMSEGG